MKRFILSIVALFIASSLATSFAAKQQAPDADVLAAKALAERIIPHHSGSFEFRKLKVGKKAPDCFSLFSENGKIVIAGNNANSMAMGLNHYIKKYCLTTISWYAGKEVTLPDSLPAINGKETIEARTANRFFLNYCTYGYTMPFWQWRDWERLIDWMALNGVNMPLAITGQEAVWYNVWRALGMSDEQVRSYFVGPAYLPWHRMANIDRWNGPLPKSWLDSQVELQKLILKRERELNMRPVLPGFAGHVPAELKDIFPDANIKYLGAWGGFDDQYRCHFLDPSEPLFAKIQKLFLEEQTRLFGTDHIYGVDPFNEVDPPSWEPEYLKRISTQMYRTLTAVDKDAIWLQMSWLFYIDRKKWTAPRVEALLAGAPKGRMMLLDYYCDYTELWQKTNKFHGQPYIWCYLGNFGGNTTMRANPKISLARLENTIANGGKNLVGIGSTLEGLDIQQAPFEEILSAAWSFPASDSIAIAHSIADRHYGAPCAPVQKAWEIIYNDVYITHSHSSGTLQSYRGKFGETDNWHYRIDYDPRRLEDAWTWLIKAPEAKTDAFIIDLVVVGRQVLGNRFLADRIAFDKAVKERDLNAMRRYATEMKELIRDIDALCACHSHSRLDTWIATARNLGSTKAESDYYEHDARNLITTWGGKGQLNDYANRSWAGMNVGYYDRRWQLYFDEAFIAVQQGRDFNQKEYDSAVAEIESDFVTQLSATCCKKQPNSCN
ncbi:MAG: alpha-N-acetylglucosaminidase, partial [Muribaculaceae bacterium]